MNEPGRIHTAGFRYDGEDRLDITRATGAGDALVLAPSWDLLRGVLAQRQTRCATHEAWLAYLEAYTLELADRHATHRAPWDRLIEIGVRQGLTLVCRCQPGTSCHRHRAANTLVAVSGGQLYYEGERE